MLARLLLAISLALASAAAGAQTVTNHAVPVGKGAGVTGFGSAGPCLANQTIVWSGTSADPACGQAFPAPTRAGDIVYWNGSAWVTLPGNNSASTPFLSETAGGLPSWAATPTPTPAYQTFHSAAGSTTVTLTLAGCGCSSLPAALSNISVVSFDGVVQARDTLSSFNSSTGVLTFAAAVPAQVQTVDVVWSFSAVSNVSSIGGVFGAVTLGSGLTSSGQSVIVDTSVVATLGANNTFTGEQVFNAGVGVGTSPMTDVHMYATNRPVWLRGQRDQVLGSGAALLNIDVWGKTKDTSTSIQWAYMSMGVDDCLIRVSVSTGPCWGNEATSGNAQGAFNFYTTNGAGVLQKIAKIDNNGITLGVSQSLITQPGTGLVSFDTGNTATYYISYNSDATNEVDIQSCNNINVTCDTGGSTSPTAIALSTNAGASNGRRLVADNVDHGQVQILGHLAFKGVTHSIPTIGGAWTASVTGGDSGGHIVWTAGSGGTLTMGTAFSNPPSCVVSFRGGVTGSYDYSGGVITFASLSASAGVADYVCFNTQ